MERFELPTFWSVAKRSNPLSYMPVCKDKYIIALGYGQALIIKILAGCQEKRTGV